MVYVKVNPVSSLELMIFDLGVCISRCFKSLIHSLFVLRLRLRLCFIFEAPALKEHPCGPMAHCKAIHLSVLYLKDRLLSKNISMHLRCDATQATFLLRISGKDANIMAMQLSVTKMVNCGR